MYIGGFMQQYFSDQPLEIGSLYTFDKQQAHHAKNVVRLNHERVRLVYQGVGYFAEGYPMGNDFVAQILEKDERINEIGVDVTLAIGLIRKEKFELVLQKATELGVTRIVPFESKRCVVHNKKEKEDKQQLRRNDIVQEAAEQCKRNRIPEVVKTVRLKDLVDYRSDINVLPYENAYSKASYLTQVLEPNKSITYVIGPEGGFDDDEVDYLKENGFQLVTLGKRILRAETAAMYACTVISEYHESRDQNKEVVSI